MRQVYAHQAALVPQPGADDRAPGDAITVALPGDLAPHTTHAERHEDGELLLRVLFAAAPDRVDEVRDRIDAALAAGAFTAPDGPAGHWRVVSAGCAEVRTGERADARRLLRSPLKP
jgi:hypothetical protein